MEVLDEGTISLYKGTNFEKHKLLKKDSRYFERGIIRGIGSLLLNCVFKIIITGGKNIPLENGVILASDHKVFIDPFVIGCAITKQTGRKDFNFVAKKELWNNVFTKYFCDLFDSIPYDRKKKDIYAAKRSLMTLRKGHILGLFIAGTRLSDEEFDELNVNNDVDFKKSFVGLAESQRKPIIPCEISYKLQFLRRIKAYVSFGEPMYVAEKTGLSAEEKKRNTNNYVDEAVKKIKQLRPAK